MLKQSGNQEFFRGSPHGHESPSSIQNRAGESFSCYYSLKPKNISGEESMENPLARRNDLVMQDVLDELLIYDLLNDKAYCLNRTAALVWRSCDGTNPVPDIARRFKEREGGPVGEDLIWAALSQLDENGLLERPIPPHFQGRSRREVLKTLGRASAVALPLVATLIVPARTTGIPVSCNGCVNPGQCISWTQCPSQTNCNPLGVCAPNPVPRSER
jgi:hypothetical protein